MNIREVLIIVAFTPPDPKDPLAAIGKLDEQQKKIYLPGDDFEPINEPSPGDWLDVHREPGHVARTVVDEALGVDRVHAVTALVRQLEAGEVGGDVGRDVRGRVAHLVDELLLDRLLAHQTAGTAVLGDDELAEHRILLEMRIGRHLQRRRQLLLSEAFEKYGNLLDAEQPLLPDPVGTLAATEQLVADGFTVLVYTSDDPVTAPRNGWFSLPSPSSAARRPMS